MGTPLFPPLLAGLKAFIRRDCELFGARFGRVLRLLADRIDPAGGDVVVIVQPYGRFRHPALKIRNGCPHVLQVSARILR